MFAQIKHMAIVSSNVNHEGDFYRDIFGMKRSGVARTGGAVVVRDGYVGLNLNPRAPGRQAGFDHFGFEVQDVELVFSRLKEKYPKVQVLKRPSNRPLPALAPTIQRAMLRPSQQGMETAPTYVKKTSKTRRISHFGLRVVGRTKSGVLPHGSDLTELKPGVIPITISPMERSRSRSCLGKSAIF
jgi:catechol 2,3-dioxygenase-like lactoylglutathione lyase family enzyme